MKTLFRTRSYLLLIPMLVVCGLVMSYAQKQAVGNKTGRVETCSKGRKIHPTINLSPDDEKELRAKLATFDTSLYRLEALNRGKIDEKRSMGTLQLSKEGRAEMAIAKKQGFTVFGPEFVHCNMVMTPLLSKDKEEEGKKMMEAIDAVLGKYQVAR
jgi:hypothetical protein